LLGIRTKVRAELKGPLFRSAQGRRLLTNHALEREEVFLMIRRRAKDAGLSPTLCCHTFRAIGITAYLLKGGTLENAQAIACHGQAPAPPSSTTGAATR